MENYNHIFFTDNEIMKNAGLSRFTLGQLKAYCENYGKDLTDLDFITTVSSTGVNPSGLYDALIAKDVLLEQPALLAWDPETNDYKYRRLTDYRFLFSNSTASNNQITSVVDANYRYLQTKYKHEKDTNDYYASGVSYTHEKNTKFINQITTSASGCITYQPKLKYSVSTNADAKTIEFSPLIRLYLRDPKMDNAPENAMALSSPIISDVPKTKGGFEYGFNITKKKETIDGIASARSPINGGKQNLQNKVAGNLDLYFDENTGKFASGSKVILARLLADLPGIVTPPVNIDAIDDSVYSEFYGDGSEQNQAGDFDKQINRCDALSLYVHNGNSKFFGPLFIDRQNATQKKEKIKITNRTSTSFVANEVIFAIDIDGEWIPMKAGSGSSGSALLKVENWSFTKLMANSDNYFRDERYEKSSLSNVFYPDYSKNVISSESYTQKMRNKYYIELGRSSNRRNDDYLLNYLPDDELENMSQQDQATLINTFISNTGEYDIIPSKKYLQSSIFDQLGYFMGGKSYSNLISRCNFDSPPNGDANDVNDIDGADFIGFWGPQFIDGYKSNQVQSLLAKKNNLRINTAGLYADDFLSNFVATSTDPAITDIARDHSVYGPRNVSYRYPSPSGMFKDSSDKVAKNLPAEAATNSPIIKGAMGSPLEDCRVYMSAFSSNVNNNLYDSIDNLLGSKAPDHGHQNRFVWLNQFDQNLPDSGIFTPVYNLTPINPAKVDFFSLSAEMVSSTDYLLNGSVRTYGNPILMNRMLSTPRYRKHLFGDDYFFTRNNITGRGFKPYGSSTTGPILKVIPYDKYVFKKSTGDVGDLFLPEIWEDETGDVVGVISSKCRIKIAGTNQIKIKCTQQFGLPYRVWSQVIAGNNDVLILGNVTGGSVNGASFNQRKDPRWGGLSDRPQDFNTTALHVKVYDTWPEEQTIYDGRYFAVFHFNPGVQRTAEVDTTVTIVPSSGSPYNPDKITETVDFRVPTREDNIRINSGTVFDQNYKMAPIAHWKVDTSRRGKLLTLGGYKHRRVVSGVNPGYHTIVSGGTNYLVGDILKGSGGGREIEAEVTSVNSNGAITGITLTNKGIEVTSLNLSNIVLVGGSGKDSEIRFTQGIVYERVYKDEGPKERVTTTRLTDTSNQGNGNNPDGTVTGVKQQILMIEEPNTTGKYDMFFHYHNDITHTLHSCSSFFPCRIQRVLMEMTVE